MWGYVLSDWFLGWWNRFYGIGGFGCIAGGGGEEEEEGEEGGWYLLCVGVFLHSRNSSCDCFHNFEKSSVVCQKCIGAQFTLENIKHIALEAIVLDRLSALNQALNSPTYPPTKQIQHYYQPKCGGRL